MGESGQGECVVALLAQESPASQAYEAELVRLGVQFRSFKTAGDVRRALLAQPFCGLLLDVATLIQAEKVEKEQIQELAEVFPTARLRWDRRTNRIRAFSFGGVQDQEFDLPTFLTVDVRRISPRHARIEKRIEVSVPTLLCPGTSFSEDSAQRALILDLSKGGCFVFSTAEWAEESHLVLDVPALTDRTPILCEIRWRSPWGTLGHWPGFGLHFDRIGGEQLSELHKVGYQSSLRKKIGPL